MDIIFPILTCCLFLLAQEPILVLSIHGRLLAVPCAYPTEIRLFFLPYRSIPLHLITLDSESIFCCCLVASSCPARFFSVFLLPAFHKVFNMVHAVRCCSLSLLFLPCRFLPWFFL
ncbi:uncharacterized protein EI90DRAFT_537622 [Cantharellus anzutake]|uniref:uncharacterized protein n=1 Tax=Cantharellus anzutake TaxID=1750568 RepID=UPI001907C412|nr:uncharacterized protein EI90DRAFT_537622 [Cantharellus anzutake]KAF8334327.1 hypothetical protein EI90DRAFT_537622 [Cantharellus anzutake]